MLVFLGAVALVAASTQSQRARAARLPTPAPAITDAQLVSGALTPPTEAQCFAIGRRCFTASAMQNSYNLPPLYAAGNEGQGVTIAIIDSFGDPNMASDLANFNTQMGLPHMCGEADHTCADGDPTFTHVYWNGQTQVKSPPANSRGTGLQERDGWIVETALDVEWAHAMAPKANILNVTTNPAETQGVQGLPNMMNAEQYIVDHHQATVITQSFGTTEEAFAGTRSLLNLRHAFISAAANDVTVLASTGDGGSANAGLTPVKNPTTFPFPTVNWPASDPLVTAVGGTYLCTNPVTGTGVDSTDPPSNCQAEPGVREIGWIDSGGGFSHIFATPSYQSTLPSGSTPIGSMRGIPDVAFQASSRTAPLVYATFDGGGGWFLVGGTSCSSPEFSGLVAIADQIAGHGLGLINPTLYAIASSPSSYAADFYDVTTGDNQADPSVPGYPATTGWDPVTGLGTPNAANLVPALAAG
ncbi:MAG TPA: S53 family peptidase [Gaiellaceae bacterium]|nr:S53 family peptidase [Gaiellaceae bacterium]